MGTKPLKASRGLPLAGVVAAIRARLSPELERVKAVALRYAANICLCLFAMSTCATSPAQGGRFIALCGAVGFVSASGVERKWLGIAVAAAIAVILSGPIAVVCAVALLFLAASKKEQALAPYLPIGLALAAAAATVSVRRTLAFQQFDVWTYQWIHSVVPILNKRPYWKIPTDIEVVGLLAAVWLSVAALWRNRKSWKALLGCTLGLVLLTILWVFANPAISLLALGILTLLAPPQKTPPEKTSPITSYAAIAVCGTLFVALTLSRSSASVPQRILFLKSTMAALRPSERPTLATPSFLNMTALLERAGCTITEADSFDKSDFSKFDLVFVVNPLTMPSRSVVQSLHNWVQNGGRMVLLTDHTDIGGIRNPSNAYLSFTHIRSRYDSAIADDPKWKWGDHARVSGLFLPQWRFGEDLGTSVGASLSIGVSPICLAEATEGYSDRGNPKYGQSHLGNEIWDRNEQYGGLCLVAEEDIGKGRVVAFGDTAQFQDYPVAVAPSQTLRLISEVQTKRPSAWTIRIWLILGAALALAAAIQGRLWGLALLTLLPILPIKPDQAFKSAQHPPLLACDTSRMPYHLQDEGDKSLSGLDFVATGAGWACINANGPSDPYAAGADIYMLVAGAKPISSQDSDRIVNICKAGTTVICPCGTDDAATLNPLLTQLGAHVTDIRLGPAQQATWTAEGYTREYLPSFKESAALQITDAQWTPLITCWGYPLVAQRPLGKGKFVLIGDSRFFESSNLVTEKSVMPQNFIFVKHLLNLR